MEIIEKNDIFIKYENVFPNFIYLLINDFVQTRKNFIYTKNISGMSSEFTIDPVLEIAKNQNGLSLSMLHGHDHPGDEFYAYNKIFSLWIKENIAENIDTIRVRLGLNIFSGNEGGIHFPHVDFPNIKHYTFLYYLDSSDGDTILYNEMHDVNSNVPLNNFTVAARNTPKANTAILFNGLRYHSSSSPTNSLERAAINVNFTSDGTIEL